MNNLQFFIFVFILSQDWPFNFFLRKHLYFLKILFFIFFFDRLFFILKGMYTKSSKPLYYIEVCIIQNFILKSSRSMIHHVVITYKSNNLQIIKTQNIKNN